MSLLSAVQMVPLRVALGLFLGQPWARSSELWAGR